jgi:hypothetical protein
MEEVPRTIPTLWPEVQRWLAANPQHVAPDNLLPAFTEEDEAEEAEGASSRPKSGRENAVPHTGSAVSGRGSGSGSGSEGEQQQALRGQQQHRRVRYTGCHFWSNFEVGRLAFFRSPAYRQLFAHLDQAGGFFYERCVAACLPACLPAGASCLQAWPRHSRCRPNLPRSMPPHPTLCHPAAPCAASCAAYRWGDAPVHTLAAAALLDRQQIRFASDVGYAHGSWSHW